MSFGKDQSPLEPGAHAEFNPSEFTMEISAGIDMAVSVETMCTFRASPQKRHMEKVTSSSLHA